MNLNKIFLIGRLTRDPELKTLPSGQPVCSFGLATNHFFVDKTNQKQKATEFHNIVLFGKLADIASRYLNKGTLVFIEGRIKTRTWQDASGNRRERTEVVAERLQLGPKTAIASQPAISNAPEEEQRPEAEEIPIIDEDNEEIDVKNIPF